MIVTFVGVEGVARCQLCCLLVRETTDRSVDRVKDKECSSKSAAKTTYSALHDFSQICVTKLLRNDWEIT